MALRLEDLESRCVAEVASDGYVLDIIFVEGDRIKLDSKVCFIGRDIVERYVVFFVDEQLGHRVLT